MFRFAVLFTAAVLMAGPALADDMMVKKLKTLNACPGCDLTGADLAEIHLEYVNLKGANLAGTDLTNANLSYTNLIGADLSNADLWGANLAGANLIKADLTGADLTGMNLKDAYSITGAKFCMTKTSYGLDNTDCEN